ncbi:MAG: hypothetical protein GXP15_07530 [Gammaproteobacteria bacterium]|nr:hypothetical protein [Gammaproteobacteria bacterium]
MILIKNRAFQFAASLGIASLLAPWAGIAFAADSPVQTLNSYRIETEDCPGCGIPLIESEQDAAAYLNYIRGTVADGYGSAAGFGGSDNVRHHDKDDDEQIVFIDFDAGGQPTFPVCFSVAPGQFVLFGQFLDHVYTAEERASIAARIAQDYSEFDYEFVTTRPTSGSFTTLSVGANDAPLDCSQGSNITVTPTGGVSILFGSAEKIDFRNQDKNDNAFADASFWEFLIQLDASGATFEAFSGLTIADFGSATAAVSQAVVNQTSNTGAHEVGHLQGLRHQNSFGAPGDGLPSTGRISPFDFVPVFPGPSNASETVLHTMASGASVGLSLSGSTITDRFFSERSATRLAIAEEGKSKSEASIRRKGRDKIKLKDLDVPNTIVIGQNANAELEVEALIVKGEISVPFEVDTYRFKAKAGDFLNVELISVVGEGFTFEEGIVGKLTLSYVESDGSLTQIASNSQSFESIFDAEIFDAVAPYKGTYVIEVSAPDEFFFADFDGDGVLDPFPLTAAGGGDLLSGRYSLQIYRCNKDLDDEDGKDHSDDHSDSDD